MPHPNIICRVFDIDHNNISLPLIPTPSNQIIETVPAISREFDINFY